MAGPGLTLATRPISSYLTTSWDSLKAAVPPGRKGTVTAGVTLQGVEVGAAYRPWSDLWLTAYYGQLWGGGREAGARLTWVF